jgi:hypothetical protein
MGKLNIKISKNAWNKGRELYATGFEEDGKLSPGRYNATITGVDVADVKGEQNVIFRFFVQEANDGKGGRLSKFFNVGTENQFVWFLRAIAKLGYDVAALKVEDIDSVVEEIIANKPVVRIRAREVETYTNIDIEALVQEKSEDAAPAEEAVAEEEKPAPAVKAAPAKAAAAPAKTPPKAAPAKTKPAAAPPAEEAVAEEAVEDAAEPAAEEGEVDLKPGMDIKATIQGKVEEATIVELHEAEKKITVKVKTTGKKWKVPLEQLSM